jgi:drug/metabolite transporter (DMT)-like permease
MTPLVVMPMTYLLEGDRPTPRAISGTVIAVAGVILLACT